MPTPVRAMRSAMRPPSDDGDGPSEIRATLMDVARARLKAEGVELRTGVMQLAMLRGQLYGRQVG